MSDRMTIDVVGVNVEVVAAGNGATGLPSALRPLAVDARADCSIDADSDDAEAVLACAVLAAIERAPGLLLHAGAVARAGRVVLFPGESGTGKSTMTAACVRRGLDYVTDEVVAVDLNSAALTGFARPMMLTRWAAGELGIDAAADQAKIPVAAEHLGSATARGPLQAAHIVTLRHSAMASGLEPLTAGQTLAPILQASFNHYRHGEQAWRAAGELARQAQGWQLDVADLDSAVDAVCGLLDGRRVE